MKVSGDHERVGPARGVLRDALPNGDFTHSRHAPPVTLAGLVQHYWYVRWNVGDQAQTVQTLPHPNVHMVIETTQSRIAGITPGRFTRTLEGEGVVFGVKFRAGGFRPFLGRSVSSIANRMLPIASVFSGADEMAQAVRGCAEPEDKIAVMNAFLAARLPPADANVDRVARIVDSIVHDRSITRVEDLAEREALGIRALQRLFGAYVGASPKWVINRYRMHEAVEQIALGQTALGQTALGQTALGQTALGAPPDWITLALGLGYFDQAHFIRDFKALVGQTPAEYSKAAKGG